MTAFIGAEALLNSRPLTYQTSNPKDETPLTPNHFLHGQSSLVEKVLLKLWIQLSLIQDNGGDESKN